MRKFLLISLVLGFVVAGVGIASADHFVFPSTNEDNRDLGWAHVNQVDTNVGETTLEFVSERGFASCFEYRTDGDTSEATSDTNFNPNAHDLYSFVCENNSSSELLIEADEYVEVRMVFGAESDERFDWTRFDVLYPVSGEIIEPEEDEIVTGITDLIATYDDGDDVNDDGVNWAVREGTCAAGVNTVFGNVDEHSDSFEWDGADFSAEWDTTGVAPGMYCFIFNPTDDPGQDDIRLTREFWVAESYVNGGGQIIEETSPKQKDWFKVSFGGWLADVGDLMGEWTVQFHNVSDNALDKGTFHATSFSALNLFAATSDTCTAAMNFTAEGTFNGEEGYTLVARAGNSDGPASMDPDDTVRFTLTGPGVSYDTLVDFSGESSCVGTARTNLDNGNIDIIDNS
jgi:hypothetical protein